MTSPVRRQWTFFAACVLALATILAAYSNAYQNSFHFDDSHVVENNLYIRNIGNFSRFFRDAATSSSFPTNANYRPLVMVSLAIDYWIGGGLEPRQFHVSQLALLVLLAAMVFFLFRGLLDAAESHWWNSYAALAGAAVFALHTTGTETMNLMHARSELMSVMGVVGSFLVYMFLPSARRTYIYLLPMFVGALAKSQAVMFGPLFVVYLFVFEERRSLPELFQSRSRTRVLAVLMRALPALIASVVILLWVESMGAAAANYGGGTPLAYLRTQLWVWLHYARLFFMPAGLTADTDWQLIPAWYSARVVVGLIFLALLLRVLWVTSRVPALGPVAFGIAWFVLALLPASSIIPLAEVANEHRVFFPYVGLSLAVVWGTAWQVERWSRARPRLGRILVRGAAVVALIAIFGNAIGTYERNKVWRTEETLWRDVTEKSPANGRGWMNFGLTQMAQGKFLDAKEIFGRAAIYTPNYAVLEVNLGIATGHLGEVAAAESHFSRALQLRPDEPSSHSFYSRWLVEQGRVSDAIPHLVQAVALSPAVVDARYQLMDAYARTGKTAELKALAVETLTLAPGDSIAGRYLKGSGALMTEPVATAAASPAAKLLDASLALYRSGDFRGSINAARQALELKPDYPEAFNNIAAGYASIHQWDEAIQAARQALRLKPDFPLARNNLAWAEEESRKSK